MDTSNRAMILPMLCRRWDKRSTGVMCTQYYHDIGTRWRKQNWRINADDSNEMQQPTTIGHWSAIHVWEEEESLRSLFENPSDWIFLDRVQKYSEGRRYDVASQFYSRWVTCYIIAFHTTATQSNCYTPTPANWILLQRLRISLSNDN